VSPSLNFTRQLEHLTVIKLPCASFFANVRPQQRAHDLACSIRFNLRYCFPNSGHSSLQVLQEVLKESLGMVFIGHINQQGNLIEVVRLQYILRTYF
jgi:hypothetical protein